MIHTDFKFRDDISKPDETAMIELTSGPYKGTIYRYTTVKIKEQRDNKATIEFDFTLYKASKKKDKLLREDRGFTNHIGVILNHLILEVVDFERAPDPPKPEPDITIDTEDLVEEAVEERTLEK